MVKAATNKYAKDTKLVKLLGTDVKIPRLLVWLP